MAISSPGIGSGLNIQSIVSQLVAVESQPVQLLQQKTATLQTKMSVFAQIKSQLATVQDAAKALMDASTWDTKSFTSSSTSAVTGSATSSALASSFKVEISKLATEQAIKTAAVTTSTFSPPGGTLSIQLGQWDASGKFTAGSAAAVPVTINAGDSLTIIAASINELKASTGVTATVVTTGTTQQLVLRGTATGAQNGFQVTASAGLETFGYPTTPAVLDGDGAVVTPPVFAGMSKIQDAIDAELTVDGIDVTSASNTVTDVVPGVTLNLLTTTTAPVTLGVGLDTESIKTKIQTFQDAYNKLNSDLKTQTAYNASTRTGGPLLGDSTAVGLQNMMRSLVGATGPATSTIGRLSDLGLQIQADGSLKTNSTKLTAALQDPDNVQEFFGASTGTATGNGIARRIYDFAFGANAVGGSVSAHSAAFQKSIDQNNKSIDKLNTRIANYQKQLLAQYTRLDANMSTLNSLSTYVSQQVAQWNKSS